MASFMCDRLLYCRLRLWSCNPTLLLQLRQTDSARQMLCKASWMLPLQMQPPWSQPTTSQTETWAPLYSL